MITGRAPRKLAAIAEALPGLETFTNDIANPEGREQLTAHLRQAMPGLDTVISNAGIQRRVGIAVDDAPWAEAQNEIDILLAGPVHLSRLLVPQLLEHGRPSIYVNVTSGGAFLPQPFAPLYSAAKAALHSYTVNLRHALRETSCRVVELIPPAVATQLAGPGHNHGADPEDLPCRQRPGDHSRGSTVSTRQGPAAAGADPALLALDFHHTHQLLDPAAQGGQMWQVCITAAGTPVGSLTAVARPVLEVR